MEQVKTGVLEISTQKTTFLATVPGLATQNFATREKNKISLLLL